MPIREKNIFDKTGSLIPGFTQYSKRKDIRDRQKIYRVEVSRLLDNSEDSVESLQKRLITDNRLCDSKKLESVRKKITDVSIKYKYSYYGESSYFANNKIEEPELLLISEYDDKISNQIKLLNELTEKSEFSLEDIASLSIFLSDIEATLRMRTNFISNYK